MKRIVTLSVLALFLGAAFAKLPAPVLSDEAKAKAAEAAAKTAHGGKVANYQLCRSMERVARPAGPARVRDSSLAVQRCAGGPRARPAIVRGVARRARAGIAAATLAVRLRVSR